MLLRNRHILILACILHICIISARSQCAAGYTTAQVNWDHLDVVFNGSPYTSYVTDALEQTQRFAIGVNSMTMYMSSPVLLNSSETGTHTGDLVNFTGNDVLFSPTANGVSITLTFATPVLDVSFALYDIDASASLVIGATDPSGNPITVTATPEASTILTISGSPGKTITASSSTATNSQNTGSVTISVAGSVSNPIKTITITVSNRGTDVNFYLSDINACVSGSFPSNWHQGFNNQPFQGNVENQPDYFIVTPDNNSAYMMDPATGRNWFLFTDATRTYMNSFAYDPSSKRLYYITENASLNSGNKQLKYYDFNNETINIAINDVGTTLGIPLFNSGIESAAASFYNGHLYLGIEGGQSTSTIRESMVWRVDLATNSAVLVFATNSYNGSGIIHDWADFIVKDGILYNCNSARSGSTYPNSSYTHFNMQTAAATIYTNPDPSLRYSGQAGLSWNGNIYMVYDSVWLYNNGVLSNRQPLSVVTVPGDPAPPAWAGNAGDGSDPFRPKCDFGDAPASYDPNPLSPAVHERSGAVRLGPTWTREWQKLGVTGNNDVDDGCSYVPFLAPGNAQYVVGVSVYNNSGSTARAMGWLDRNGNGVFDAGEAVGPILVSSSASNQTIYLHWTNANNTFTNGSTTYLRIRITTGAMTSADATGYFSDGEVEDYIVRVDNYPLSAAVLDFDAILAGGKNALLSWQSEEDDRIGGYELQRSGNGRDFTTIQVVGSSGRSGTFSYQYTDPHIAFGTHYYRVRIIGSGRFSDVKKVQRLNPDEWVEIRPNPVRELAIVAIESYQPTTTELRLVDINGKEIYRRQFRLVAGSNQVPLPVGVQWPNGTYILTIQINQEMINRKLVIHR